jgi:hypothetical protein
MSPNGRGGGFPLFFFTSWPGTSDPKCGVIPAVPHQPQSRPTVRLPKVLGEQ